MDKKLLFDLACPHCSNVLNEPVTMPCGHHVCTACMHTLSEGRNKFSCPVCCMAVPMAKCIPNQLMHKVIHELSNARISEVAPISGQRMHSVHLPPTLPQQPQDAFLQQALNPIAQHQFPIHMQQFLPVHGKSPLDLGVQPLPLGVSAQKAQSQPADRLVLTHNQRQYIRYVVVTDCDTGIKYTVGIKHVLNTVGSSQLVQLLEKNIGSEYKKGSSKRVCKSVVHGVACLQGAECPFIHVTQEGWEARRKFSSANQKRNKDASGLTDPSPPLAPGTLLDPGLLPYLGLEAQRAKAPALQAAPAMLGTAWAAPATCSLNPPLNTPISLGMFAGGSVPHLPRTLQEDLDSDLAQQEGDSQRSPNLGPQSATATVARFPVPITRGFPYAHFDFNGIDVADLRQQPDFRLHGTAFGSSNPIPFQTQLSLNPLGTSTSSSSSGADVRTPQESSAASTTSSIGAISSSSYTGSPLASPLIESIATTDLPEPLTEKPNDFAEGSRMIPYFNKNNLLGSLGDQG
eukprot:GGOE01005258.1.p1 GENE.GGOE01005258.1~~GGOE01005258.1.p1  ORF type:complete len:516 (-),score=50.03 GGOE01005258.1:1712-3259(-)